MIKYSYVVFATTLYSYALDQTDSHFLIRNSLHNNSPIAYIFAHGLGANQQQALNYTPQNVIDPLARWIINEPLALFDFPDARIRENEYHAKYVNLGQKRDLERIHSVFQRAQTELLNHDFIFMGLSRGAATILNYAALYDSTRIKALIVESSFDTIKSIIKNLMRRFHVDWLPFATSIGFKIAQTQFPDLDTKGFFPLETIIKLPKSLPVILIHSKKDRVIPIKSSRKIYLVLKSLGYEEIYLVELSHGLHGKLMQGKDAELYQNIIHAFYKKYNLPHNNTFALKGEPFLALCQPSMAEVIYRIKRKKISS